MFRSHVQTFTSSISGDFKWGRRITCYTLKNITKINSFNSQCVQWCWSCVLWHYILPSVTTKYPWASTLIAGSVLGEFPFNDFEYDFEFRNLPRDHFLYEPSQWETTLPCNVVSHWLGTYTKRTLPSSNDSEISRNISPLWDLKKTACSRGASCTLWDNLTQREPEVAHGHCDRGQLVHHQSRSSIVATWHSRREWVSLSLHNAEFWYCFSWDNPWICVTNIPHDSLFMAPLWDPGPRRGSRNRTSTSAQCALMYFMVGL